MDDIGPLLQELALKYAKKLAESLWALCLSVLAKAVRVLGTFFAWMDRTAGEAYARLSWYEIALIGLAAAAVTLLFLFRRRIYRNFLIYNIHWLRFQGYSRQIIRVRRAGRERRVDIMGLPVPLPERFASLRIYKAVPERYVVAFGAYGKDKALRLCDYAREGGLGYAAMRRDFADYFRRTAKFQNPASETQGLLDYLGAADPGFSQNANGREGSSRPRRFADDRLDEAASFFRNDQ